MPASLFRSLPLRSLLFASIGWLNVASASHADEPNETKPLDPQSVEFFEKRIRPLLAEKCWSCHSVDQIESELRLDARAEMLEGGSRGPAVVPGDPEKSLLIRAVNHADTLQMPPKTKLPAKDIADLSAWVKMGALWPGDNSQTTSPKRIASKSGGSSMTFSDEQKTFWAFQPMQRPLPPRVTEDSAQSPIDRFIVAELAARGLRPNPVADKRTLIRRATFDLLGLPPTADEVAEFLADESPDAMARVIDRLLASPRYGERWGRHWLDVARYADSNGLDENLAHANAFRYRDWVISALNRDLPFDQFIQEQIAGDLLPADGDPNDPLVAARQADRVTATGFLVIGAKMLAEDDPLKMQMDIIDEQLDTLGKAFLGMTLGCARCHDHKFDPITMSDYYSLAGIFKSTKTMNNFKVVAQWQERPIASPELLRKVNDAQQHVAAKQNEISNVVQHAEQQSPTKISEEQFDEECKRALEHLRAELKSLQAAVPKLPEAMAVSEGAIEDLPIHRRGNHTTLAEELQPRRFPRVFVGEQTLPIGNDRSGRLELARWLTGSNHPLTARVAVNRVWLWHFGAGLVRSPDNFGLLGQRPTHPDLLDWLATELVGSFGGREVGRWSMKQLHRTIMSSATYQMLTTFREDAFLADPDNRLWWRRTRQRLEVEAIRDSLLAVSGRLENNMGGSQLPTANRAYVTGTANFYPQIYNSHRRSVYLPVVRSALYELYQVFDFAEPSVMSGQRDSTTVATQALFMLNSALVSEQSRELAARLMSVSADDDPRRVSLAYQRLFQREPSSAEIARAIEFEKRLEASASSTASDEDRRLAAWRSVCRALLGSNEFLFVE